MSLKLSLCPTLQNLYFEKKANDGKQEDPHLKGSRGTSKTAKGTRRKSDSLRSRK